MSGYGWRSSVKLYDAKQKTKKLEKDIEEIKNMITDMKKSIEEMLVIRDLLILKYAPTSDQSDYDFEKNNYENQ